MASVVSTFPKLLAGLCFFQIIREESFPCGGRCLWVRRYRRLPFLAFVAGHPDDAAHPGAGRKAIITPHRVPEPSHGGRSERMVGAGMAANFPSRECSLLRIFWRSSYVDRERGANDTGQVRTTPLQGRSNNRNSIAPHKRTNL